MMLPALSCHTRECPHQNEQQRRASVHKQRRQNAKNCTVVFFLLLAQFICAPAHAGCVDDAPTQYVADRCCTMWDKLFEQDACSVNYDRGKTNFDGLLGHIDNSLVRLETLDQVPVAYYRRHTDTNVSVYDLLLNEFKVSDDAAVGNKMHSDFDIFDTETDAIQHINAWQYCPFTSTPGVGFPSFCGTTDATKDRYINKGCPDSKQSAIDQFVVRICVNSAPPSQVATPGPTASSKQPTAQPTRVPSKQPSQWISTGVPTALPSQIPTRKPSVTPTHMPSTAPTHKSSISPSIQPSKEPTVWVSTSNPTVSPTVWVSTKGPSTASINSVPTPAPAQLQSCTDAAPTQDVADSCCTMWDKLFEQNACNVEYDRGKTSFDGLLDHIQNSLVRVARSDQVPVAYYRRHSETSLSVYDLLLNEFKVSDDATVGNKMHTDFDIFSTETDAIQHINAWQYCPHVSTPGVGFPSFCGTSDAAKEQYINKGCPNSKQSAINHFTVSICVNSPPSQVETPKPTAQTNNPTRLPTKTPSATTNAPTMTTTTQTPTMSIQSPITSTKMPTAAPTTPKPTNTPNSSSALSTPVPTAQQSTGNPTDTPTNFQTTPVPTDTPTGTASPTTRPTLHPTSMNRIHTYSPTATTSPFTRTPTTKLTHWTEQPTTTTCSLEHDVWQQLDWTLGAMPASSQVCMGSVARIYATTSSSSLASNHKIMCNIVTSKYGTFEERINVIDAANGVVGCYLPDALMYIPENNITLTVTIQDMDTNCLMLALDPMLLTVGYNSDAESSCYTTVPDPACIEGQTLWLIDVSGPNVHHFSERLLYGDPVCCFNSPSTSPTSAGKSSSEHCETLTYAANVVVDENESNNVISFECVSSGEFKELRFALSDHIFVHPFDLRSFDGCNAGGGNGVIKNDDGDNTNNNRGLAPTPSSITGVNGMNEGSVIGIVVACLFLVAMVVGMYSSFQQTIIGTRRQRRRQDLGTGSLSNYSPDREGRTDRDGGWNEDDVNWMSHRDTKGGGGRGKRSNRSANKKKSKTKVMKVKGGRFGQNWSKGNKRGQPNQNISFRRLDVIHDDEEYNDEEQEDEGIEYEGGVLYPTRGGVKSNDIGAMAMRPYISSLPRIPKTQAVHLDDQESIESGFCSDESEECPVPSTRYSENETTVEFRKPSRGNGSFTARAPKRPNSSNRSKKSGRFGFLRKWRNEDEEEESSLGELSSLEEQNSTRDYKAGSFLNVGQEYEDDDEEEDELQIHVGRERQSWHSNKMGRKSKPRGASHRDSMGSYEEISGDDAIKYKYMSTLHTLVAEEPTILVGDSDQQRTSKRDRVPESYKQKQRQNTKQNKSPSVNIDEILYQRENESRRSSIVNPDRRSQRSASRDSSKGFEESQQVHDEQDVNGFDARFYHRNQDDHSEYTQEHNQVQPDERSLDSDQVYGKGTKTERKMKNPMRDHGDVDDDRAAKHAHIGFGKSDRPTFRPENNTEDSNNIGAQFYQNPMQRHIRNVEHVNPMGHTQLKLKLAQNNHNITTSGGLSHKSGGDQQSTDADDTYASRSRSNSTVETKQSLDNIKRTGANHLYARDRLRSIEMDEESQQLEKRRVDNLVFAHQNPMVARNQSRYKNKR